MPLETPTEEISRIEELLRENKQLKGTAEAHEEQQEQQKKENEKRLAEKRAETSELKSKITELRAGHNNSAQIQHSKHLAQQQTGTQI